jgi:uncharacterized repeat protein (TIGR03803 family)
MKTFRAAASLMLFGALTIATSVDMSATSRTGVDVVHSFGGGADGSVPETALRQATDGNFYRTTTLGGPSNKGTVFKMTPAGAVTIVHAFTGGLDGSNPKAPLVQANGRLRRRWSDRPGGVSSLERGVVHQAVEYELHGVRLVHVGRAWRRVGVQAPVVGEELTAS